MSCEIDDGYTAHLAEAGFVHAPDGPGLGVDVDWALIPSATLVETA